MDGNGFLDGFGFAVNEFDEAFATEFADFVEGLVDGGEAGNGKAGLGDVVKSNHGDVLRDAETEFVELFDGAEGHFVVEGEDGGDALVASEEFFDGVHAAFFGEPAVHGEVGVEGDVLFAEGFLEGVKEAAGIEDLTEMEAACLLRVLAKPELDNAIILNEFTMIMENFGVPDLPYGGEDGAEDEDDDDFDDYVRDEDYFEDLTPEELAKQE